MNVDQILADCRVPVLGICAYSGTGKTTLLKKLIPELNRRGKKLAVIKHAHHNFDVDIPGKDSYELRKSGAEQMLVASHIRRALMAEKVTDGDPDLKELLGMIDQTRVDMILVEGFKKLPLPKLELHRAEVGKPFVFTQDDAIRGIAVDADTQLPEDLAMPVLDINDVDAIADFIEQFAADWKPVGYAPLGTCGCDDVERKQLSVAQGQARILSEVKPVTAIEATPLLQAQNRVLGADIASPVNVPQHTNSAMDGYAIRNDGQHDSFTVVAEVLAGHGYDAEVQSGEAVKIMTGAPLPAGVDTVIMRELATQEGDQVRFDGDIETGQNIRQAGEDIAVGATALTAGNRIGPAELGLLASLGLGELPVYRKPKVAVFSTGDEVCQPGEPLKPNCIFDSNRFTIQGMLAKLGCEVVDLGILEDTEEAMADALQAASEQADVVITSGGVSVGDADFIKPVMERLGHIDFWKIAMRPGRPLAFGKIKDTLLFGLPGNPVAVMVSFMQFVQPALRKMMGEPNWKPQMMRATAGEPMRSKQGRTEFQRGIMQLNSLGELTVTTTGAQGSGILSSMVQGNCLIIIEECQGNVSAGEAVWVQPFADLL
ncbi:bifunctional molybdopterin-guanine dinucleotide biosynthesis adaptor protein MobB/molybdopterin molybdotransferase MoeA [Ferrimonas sp. YFM]|uniref:bifunctional molybdopterin-guanine dinucleotide biosynthesis adaptor protein MobB/molybdopterin molybdotransferase MoeA n=1 Tax=Ferrimonas sp. YFM TaxID=3028878 RepID=UPI0025744EFD|nr:bifunctional molybdopterin-guanine dinucleotide biosynthesis adaptor protein MobB/molybdopterin molybdotransferase MoeA [Ferrimonas sp. YFM]BDY07005.1 bifunctional molybdopterin-guanine dinucleotide biosynthesis protein MobB/molybdopterin molybdotransferase MoeA [Ferrimonas sp. YFM]